MNAWVKASNSVPPRRVAARCNCKTGYADDALVLRKHYPKLASESGAPELISAVGHLLPRIFEFSKLLVDRLGVVDVGAWYPHAGAL